MHDINEKTLHKQCKQYFDYQYSSTGAIFHHSPNENPRSNNQLTMIKYNQLMQSLGRQKGYPDIEIIYNSKTLYIELKTYHGVLSPEQKALHEQFKQNGYIVYVIRTLDQFIDITEQFFNNTL